MGTAGSDAWCCAHSMSRVAMTRSQIVAVNDLGDAQTNAYLTTRDTAHGIFQRRGQRRRRSHDRQRRSHPRVFAERDPSKLPWGEMGVDVVLECTGLFRTKEKAGMHLAGGRQESGDLGTGRRCRCHYCVRRQPRRTEGRATPSFPTRRVPRTALRRWSSRLTIRWVWCRG